MKKLLAVTVALVLTLGAFAGCGSTPASSAAPSTAAPASSAAAPEIVEITWWAPPTFIQDGDDPAGTYEQKVIDAFQSKNPNIKVTLETIDFTNAGEKITAAIEGGTAADVLFDAPGRIIEYGKNGKLVSLDDMFTDEFVKDVNNDDLLSSCKGNDTYYMYPISASPFYMAINEKMWTDSGAMEFVNLEGDRSWTTENFGKALEKLHAAGYAPGVMFCSGQGGDQGTRAFINNLYDGTTANAARTEYNFNSEANIKALTQAQEWIKGGLLGNGVSYNGGQSIELFVSGTTSFEFCWGTSAAGNNAATMESNGVKPISLPFPSADGKPSLEYLVNGFCVFDNGNAAKAEAAKTFIKFICDDKTWGATNVVRTGAFPVRTSFGNLYPNDTERELLAKFTSNYGPYYNTMDGFANMRTEWWNMLQAVTGGEDVKTVADKAVAAANAGMAG